MRSRKNTIFFIASLAVVVAVAIIFRNAHFVKIYPLLVTGTIGLQFALTLAFPPTTIERIAALVDKDFSEDAIPYCRKLTWIWIGFFIVNFAISLASAFGSWSFWIAWNCVVSYIFMGALFGGEMIFRRWWKRRVAERSRGFVVPSKLLTMPNFSARGNAFYLGGNAISCARFRQCAAYFAKILRERPESRVVVHAENNAIFALGFFAALLAKKTIILPHNLQLATAESLRENTIFLTATDGILLDYNVVPADFEAFPHLCELDRETQIFFFSSGSTGTPKMLERTWGNTEDEIVRLHNFLPKIATNHVLASVRAYHIYGLLYAFLLPLCRGNAIVGDLVEFPEELAVFAQKDNAFYFVSSPVFLSRWTRDPASMNLGVPAENCVILSSASLLDFKTAKAIFDATGIGVYEVYGSTETGGVAWRQQAIDARWTAWEDGSVSKRESDDALVVRSSILCKTDEFVMGDAVEFCGKNQFRLLGRLNRLIKVEDLRVSLPEMEEFLMKSPLVEEVFLTTIVNKIGRLVLGAVVVKSAAGTAMSEKELTGTLKVELQKIVPALVVPKKWRYVPAIPRNEQSKILAKDIEKLFE